MAVVKGTNAGFVETAPTSNPNGLDTSTDGFSRYNKDTSPSGATKITEIGWWCADATEEANFEVAIYADAAGRPGDLIGSISSTNAKGTGTGWKTATVDIDISGNTIYWIGMQLDDTATETEIDYNSIGEIYYRSDGGQTQLNDPATWTVTNTGLYMALYAVYEIGATGTNLQINIGDVWKEVPAVQINIGDAWKEVAGMQINIGDTWKTIF